MKREFGCSDGECIPLDQRCDGVPDCDNGFDENNCQLLKADSGNYRKELEPHQRNEDRVNVRVNFIIFALGSIDETDMTFSAKFLIDLEW